MLVLPTNRWTWVAPRIYSTHNPLKCRPLFSFRRYLTGMFFTTAAGTALRTSPHTLSGDSKVRAIRLPKCLLVASIASPPERVRDAPCFPLGCLLPYMLDVAVCGSPQAQRLLKQLRCMVGGGYGVVGLLFDSLCIQQAAGSGALFS